MLKENLKSYILISLIITSLMQVGILWDYQTHRLPFNFLTAFSGMKSVKASNSVNELKKYAFEPYRIIVSQGEGESHWILNRNNDTQSDYYRLWNEGRNYLEGILNSSNIQSTSELSISQWDNLAIKKGIIFEFKTTLKTNLLSYFLGTNSKTSPEFSGVYKMIISPWDNINYYNTIYILDGSSKVQSYVVSMRNSKLKKEKYDEIMKKLEDLTQKDELRSYNIIKETNNTVPYPVRQDMPIAIEGTKYETYTSISSSIPDSFIIKENRKVSQIEDKFDSVFQNEKDSYDMLTEDNGIVTFKNINNIYRFYDDGVLEYRNITYSTENERLDEGLAMKQALEFIEKLKFLPQNASLYLSSIKEDEAKDRFKITFDYELNGLPIVFDYEIKDQEQNKLNNAITLEVNNSKVISCWWIIRDFELLKGKDEYSIKFDELMNRAMKQYPQLRSDKNFFVKDAAVGYEVKSDTGNTILQPVWFIFTQSGDRYPVKMGTKKGE